MGIHPALRHSTALAVGALAVTAALAGSAPAYTEPAEIEGAQLHNRATWTFTSTKGYTLPGGSVSVWEGELGNHGDALDSALELNVGGEALTASTGRLRERRLTVGPRTVAELSATVTYQALPRSSTLRVLVTLENRGDADVTRPVRFGSNLGSDNETTIIATSDDDNVFDDGDRWVSTTDSVASPDDPIVTQVYGGRGRGLTQAGQDGPATFFGDRTVQVPAGKERHLLLFLQLDTTIAKALRSIDRFDGKRLPERLLSGISPNDRRELVNWNL